MIEASLAHPARETTDHLERGRQLFEERGVEFRYERGAWLVPSENGGGLYEVRLSPIESCECADFEHSGPHCEHIVAASIAQTKSRTCCCCGQRVLSRFTSEVTEDDALLSWFPGDVLCADCVRAGYWV